MQVVSVIVSMDKVGHMRDLKNFLCVLAGLVMTQGSWLAAQGVGIGVADPVEQLDVNGAIRLGSSAGQHSGTIRWNPLRQDFEGYNGTKWVSLTGNQGSWGRQESFSMEDWGSTFTLTLWNNQRGKHLGASLAARGTELFAGAPDDYGPSGQVNAGSVRLIRSLSGRWKEYPDIDLFSPAPAANERFGASVSISGQNLAVGAPGANSTKGKIYLYASVEGMSPNFKGSFVLLDGATGDGFGHAVSASADFVLASAPFKDIGSQFNIGVVKVYKYFGATDSWLLYQSINDPEPTQNAVFGRALSVSYPYAAIAAPSKAHSGMANAGKVYLYQYNGASWSVIDTLVAPDAEAQDEFGYAVDLRADTLVVGAPQFGNQAPDATGKVYTYLRNGNQWDLQEIILNPDGVKSQQFGASLSTAEGFLVVGASRANIGILEDAGKAHVYHWTPTGLVWQTTLSNSLAADGDQFGLSVLCREGSLVIGAPNQDLFGYLDNGRIFYYYR